MKKLVLALGVCVSTLVPALGHDLFLKLDTFFVGVNDKVSITILNGTFQASEAAVAFARITDLTVVSPSGTRTHPTEDAYRPTGTISIFDVTPAQEGSYVVGLSTMWRENQLPAKEFNEYLVAEGIPGVLEDRKRDKELEVDGRYRYSKYVKAIFQAGAKPSANYNAVLGYAVEMVPVQNPYALRSGASIDIQCLKDGKPLAGQTVLFGSEADGKLASERPVVTDDEGKFRIRLNRPGKWYAKFINMVKVSDPKLNYESKWATLTFEIKK